ncbi:nucleotide exchange factor GrpE [Gordonia polyisoprenivorans]|uniref:nucleotide exchange factor GrpE n=1 Tax=Gordonia polyisoprenivorans TaxID=84595 RepID=UPI0030D066B4
MTEGADEVAGTGKGAGADEVAEQVRRLDERVEDLGRVIARQSQSLERLLDAEKKRSARDAAGADLALLVDLLALFGDALGCASSSADAADRAAFTALADGLERLIVGHGGTPVTPRVGDDFDATTMDAVDTRETGAADRSRTVAGVLRPGLNVGSRSVRPAAVIVYR